MSLLHPKWWLLHVFTVASIIAMFFLGRWQWHVAHQHHGDIRYYAYAFQWWAFCGFAALMWARVVLDFLRGGRETLESAETTAETQVAGGYRAYVPPNGTVPDEDDEQARFNAYLRALNTESKGRE